MDDSNLMFHYHLEIVEREISRAASLGFPIVLFGEEGTGRRHYVAWATVLLGFKPEDSLVVDSVSDNEEFNKSLDDALNLLRLGRYKTIAFHEIERLSLVSQRRIAATLSSSDKLESMGPRVLFTTGEDCSFVESPDSIDSQLFYKIVKDPVRLPSLREIRNLLPDIAKSYVQEKTEKTKTIADKMLETISQINYPGNFNQFFGVLDRAISVSGNENIISFEHLNLRTLNPVKKVQGRRLEGTLKETLQAVERELITVALMECNGNKSKASKKLGISRAGLISKVQMYKIRVKEQSAEDKAS